MPTKTTKTPKTAANGPPSPPGEVLTLAEAAALLRVPEEGLKTDAAAGRVPGRLVAGEWRFVRATLLAWLSQPEPSKKSSKERMLAVAGMWKDDPTVDAMVEEIYRRRKANPVGGK
jgi:hypothetical protein